MSVPKSLAMKQADACPLKENHNDYPTWGYDNMPTEEFAAAHIQCRCKGCGLYLVWIAREVLGADLAPACSEPGCPEGSNAGSGRHEARERGHAEPSLGPSQLGRSYAAYVCDRCHSITDAHGEPVGCVNTGCDAPTMRLVQVVEVTDG